MLNIVFLHMPTMWNKPTIAKELVPIINKLSRYGNVYNYFFKFSYYSNKFELNDLLFENAADDIHNKVKHLKKYLIISYNHACPIGLYYANKYSNDCLGIICYPYRFYCKESYERRIWKLKNNNGWISLIKSKEYDVDKYLFKINNTRLQKLLKNPQEDEKQILYLIMDVMLQKQYNKIPKVFKVSTILYTRLDMDVESIIKFNFDRKDIAKMKQIINKNDALYNSMMWNFDRIKYDAVLKKSNKNNKHLKIKYLVSGWEDNYHIINEVILFNHISTGYKFQNLSKFKEIYFIRHGETEWNHLGKTQGAEVDISLNNKGTKESEKTGLYLKKFRTNKLPFDCILSSSMKRSKETAKIISKYVGINKKDIIYMSELKETKMGKLSGLTNKDKLKKIFMEQYARAKQQLIDPIEKNQVNGYKESEEYFSDKTMDIGFESYAEVIQRINYIITYLTETKNEKIIVVSHSGFLDALLKEMFGLGILPKGDLTNGTHNWIMYCTYQNNKFKMISPANTEHLSLM